MADNLNLTKPERPYYYIYERKWYYGSLPMFYNSDEIPGLNKLVENYDIIKGEILDYYAKYGSKIKPNFSPYAYGVPGWRTVDLYSYSIRYKNNCVFFPKTTEIVQQIPGMCGAQIAVLLPHTYIKGHFGDTSVIIRNHLGIVIPGTLPQLGLRVKNKDICWQEGKVFSFNPVHRHCAWNFTDSIRIQFQVDVLRPEYRNRRFLISGLSLASMATKFLAVKSKFLRRMPKPIVFLTHRTIGLCFAFLLWFQVKTNTNMSEFFSSIKER
ncbi:MAG TPA: aspartyl/asparaginyl beta-hydroxylase domain-containing protein [Chitinophagales bacterium]|nr:aspartyl/asparaginyl beta-hydroxylase domain-containing protein [Chitinophagales bacterium]